MFHKDIKPVGTDSEMNYEIPIQPASLDIWDQKYRLKKKDGSVIDDDIHATLDRVARVLADQEKNKALRQHWYQKFLWALETAPSRQGELSPMWVPKNIDRTHPRSIARPPLQFMIR